MIKYLAIKAAIAGSTGCKRNILEGHLTQCSQGKLLGGRDVKDKT